MSGVISVTGGAGFIGSHLCELLLTRGYRLRVLDNPSLGRREWMPAEAEFMDGDVADAQCCRAACENVNTVLHLAAMSRAAPSLDAIDACTQSNIVGTQNIPVAARDAGVKRFVYSGSSTYYASFPTPHREDMRPQFLNFYALSKYVGEEYCRLFEAAFGLSTVVLRYFNVYGPRQPEIGAHALVLRVFLKRGRDGLPLEIHGGGEQRRDFVHVRDVARAIVVAMESEVRNVAINIGSGTNYSVNEVADMISPAQIRVARRAGGAEATVADISRARETTRLASHHRL